MYTFVCLRQHWCFNPGIPWDYILATFTIMRPITAHFTSSQPPPLWDRITVASTLSLTWSLLITNKDQVHANLSTNRNQLYSVSNVIFLISVFEFMCCSFLLRIKLPLPSPSTPTPPRILLSLLQYIPRNMHTVFALLCFVVVIHWLIFPYPSGLLHWHCGNLTSAPVPAKQPWWIWINTPCEFIMNDCITTTKHSTTKPCAYFLGYTVLLLYKICVPVYVIWYFCCE